VLDLYAPDFGVTFMCTLATAIGSGRTFDVEHTLDNILLQNVSGRYMDHSTVSGETVAQDGSYTEPVRAIRLKINGSAAAASGRAVTMRVLQVG
jgi:hypothetical protein